MPRLSPGHAVAAVSTVGLILTAPGQTMLVSLLNLPLQETYGLRPLWINTAYMAATIAASLPLVWVGALTDRLGPRRMLVLVALAFGGACGFVATIAHPAMIPLAFFALRFLGQGSLSLVSNHLVAMWFHRQLGRIHGVRQVALFGVWAGLPALTLALISSWGWRQTWAAFGVLIPALLIPLTLRFVRDRPEELGLTLDGDAAPASDAGRVDEPGHTLREAYRTRAFWILVAATVLPPMIGTALIFETQPLLLERGLDRALAGRVVGAFSLAMALMALPVGQLIDRRDPRGLIAIGTLGIGGSCLLWLLTASVAWATAAMALYGVGASLAASTIGTTAARYFGRAHHGAIRSALTRIGVISTGLGPLVTGVCRDLTGGYDGALIGFAAICIPVVIASRWLVSPAAARPVGSAA